MIQMEKSYQARKIFVTFGKVVFEQEIVDENILIEEVERLRNSPLLDNSAW